MNTSLKNILIIIFVAVGISIVTVYIVMYFFILPSLQRDIEASIATSVANNVENVSQQEYIMVKDSTQKQARPTSVEEKQAIQEINSLVDEYNNIQQQLTRLYEKAQQYDDGTNDPPIPAALAEKIAAKEVERDAVNKALGAPDLGSF